MGEAKKATASDVMKFLGFDSFRKFKDEWKKLSDEDKKELCVLVGEFKDLIENVNA
jgi:hypothetical protein